MTRIIFEDCEFTNLVPPWRPGGGRLWEVGLVVRDLRPGWLIGAAGHPWEETELRWLVSDVDLSTADPQSLAVGRFHERHPMFSQAAADEMARSGNRQVELVSQATLALRVAAVFEPGAVVVGANPTLDVDHFRDLLFRHGLPWVPDYHVYDVESLAAGTLAVRRALTVGGDDPESPDPGGRVPGPPWSHRAMLAALDVAGPETGRHTALGDAREVRDVWDKVMTGATAALLRGRQ